MKFNIFKITFYSGIKLPNFSYSFHDPSGVTFLPLFIDWMKRVRVERFLRNQMIKFTITPSLELHWIIFIAYPETSFHSIVAMKTFPLLLYPHSPFIWSEISFHFSKSCNLDKTYWFDLKNMLVLPIKYKRDEMSHVIDGTDYKR